MAIKEGQEGIDFQGRRGVNAGDALHDRDLVTLRQLRKSLASFTGSSSSLSGVSIVSIGQGYPVYAGLNSGNYEFRSFSALTPNLLMYCGDTITYALNDNIIINGLTATTITAGTIDAGLYLSAGTPLQQYFDRYWTASTGNQSVVRKFGNHSSPGSYSIVSGGKNHINNGNYSGVFAGSGNTIFANSPYSSIVNGLNNSLSGINSSILGGRSNVLNANFSTIINGNGIVVNQNYTVAVPYLRIVNTSVGGTYMLTTDNNGYVFRQGIPIGGSGTFSGVTNLGGTHGIYAGSTLGRIQLKSLSGGSNIIITSSSTENAISLSSNVGINSLFVSGNTILSSTTAMTMTVLNLSGSGTQMVVVNNFGALSGQSVPTPGVGGFGTITNATNTGSTHGIYAGLSGSSVLIFKSLSGGSNIIITSSSTENAISLSPNVSINSLFVSGNTVLSSTTAMTMTVLNLSGSGNQMVVVNNFGVLSGQSIPTPGLGGFGTVTGAVNTGSTHGIYAGLSGSSVLVFKALSGGSNIIISSSTTENAIALSRNVSINSLTSSGNSVFAGTLSGGSSFSANTLFSGSTNLYSIFSPLGHTHPLTDITGGNLGDTIRHNGTNWIANNFLYNPGHKVGINNTNLNSTFSIYSTGNTTATTSFLIYNNSNERLLSFWANGLMELNPLSTFSIDPGTPVNSWYEKPIYPSRLFIQDWTDSNSTTTGKTTVLIQGQANNQRSGNTALWVRSNVAGSPDAVAIFEHSNPLASVIPGPNSSSIIRVIGGALGVLKTGLTINADCLTAFGTGLVDNDTQVLISLQNRTSMSSFNALKLVDNNNNQLLKVRGDAQVTIRSLTGLTTQMVVADSSGVLSVQTIPTGGGGSSSIANVSNTGSTHGIYAGLSGSSVVLLKSLSGGSNIIITSSSTENAIALSPNVVISSLSANSISATTYYSGSTPLSSLLLSEIYWTGSTGFQSLKRNNSANNQLAGEYSIITAGKNNYISSDHSIIGSGQFNSIYSSYSAILGGKRSIITSFQKYSSIVGGSGNTITSSYSSIIAGQNNYTSHSHSSILAGKNISTVSANTAHAENLFVQNQVRISGLTGSGNRMVITSSNGTLSTQSLPSASIWIAGSGGNSIRVDNGYTTANADFSMVAGKLNTVVTSSTYGVVLGGVGNEISTNSTFSTILNGTEHLIRDYGTYSFIGGGRGGYILKSTKSSIINGYVNKIYNSIVAQSIYNQIFNGYQNKLNKTAHCTILGGYGNAIGNGSNLYVYSNIFGGKNNTILANYSNILGGNGIVLSDNYTTLVDRLQILNAPQTDNATLLNINTSDFKVGHTTLSGGSGIKITTALGNLTITYTGSTSSGGGSSIVNGLNTYTAGTSTLQSVNISAATLNNLTVTGITSLATLSADTINIPTLINTTGKTKMVVINSGGTLSAKTIVNDFLFYKQTLLPVNNSKKYYRNTPFLGAVGVGTFGANTIVLSPLYIPRDCEIDEMMINIVTTGGTGVFSLAVYDNLSEFGLHPGYLKQSFGSGATSPSGIRRLTASTVGYYSAGMYWLALWNSSSFAINISSAVAYDIGATSSNFTNGATYTSGATWNLNFPAQISGVTTVGTSHPIINYHMKNIY